ncbi:MAG: sigma-70 family RNA polymerase sigma factor [Bryobacteraceae bacterium]
MATSQPAPGSSQPPDLTLLLQRMQQGDHQAGEKAIALLYSELHRIAARELRKERPGHMLQTTALIHEAYARLAGSEALEIQNRAHFFSLASQQMRRVLVDYARARNAQRRGAGAIAVGLEGVQAGSDPRGIDLLSLDEALGELQRVDARAAQVVELRFFGGYTDREVAEALATPLGTIRRDWEFARSWLFDRMRGDRPESPAPRA